MYTILRHCLAPIYLITTLTYVSGDETTFRYPIALASTDDGVIFVADRQLPGVWKIESGVTSEFFRGSRRFGTPLNAIHCVAVDQSGRLLAGDSSTREIYRFDASGNPTGLTNGHIGIPMSIAVAADGTIYTADLELHRIWKMPSAGSEQPEEFAVINSPRGLTLDAEGNLWVLSTSSQHGQIQMIRPDGQIESFVNNHPFRMPQNLIRTSDGNFYVTDNYSRCVWQVSVDGDCIPWLQGPPLDRPVGLCRLRSDFLVTDPHISTIFRIKPDRTIRVFNGPDTLRKPDNAE